MEINLQIGDQHATLTLSSSAPTNRALVVASLVWDEPKPPYRSMHERDAIAVALADLSRLIGATPMVLDLGPRQPLHERRPTTCSRVENAPQAVSVAMESTQ